MGTLQHDELPEEEGPMPCPQLVLSSTTKESQGSLKHFFAVPCEKVFACVFWAIGLSSFV